MPPESFTTNPVYDYKLDIFSFGVLLLAIAIGQPPRPINAHHRLGTDGQEYTIPELERRQHDLNALPQNHPFRPLILACLHDNPADRPSAVEVHQQILLIGQRYSSADQVGNYCRSLLQDLQIAIHRYNG